MVSVGAWVVVTGVLTGAELHRWTWREVRGIGRWEKNGRVGQRAASRTHTTGRLSRQKWLREAGDKRARQNKPFQAVQHTIRLHASMTLLGQSETGGPGSADQARLTRMTEIVRTVRIGARMDKRRGEKGIGRSKTDEEASIERLS